MKYFQKLSEKYEKIGIYGSYIRENSARIFRSIIIFRTFTYVCTHKRSGHETVIIYARYRVSRSFAVDRGDCDRDQRHTIGICKHLTVEPADFSRFAIGSLDHSAPLFRDHCFDGNVCSCTIYRLIIK